MAGTLELLRSMPVNATADMIDAMLDKFDDSLIAEYEQCAELLRRVESDLVSLSEDGDEPRHLEIEAALTVVRGHVAAMLDNLRREVG